MNEQIAFKEGNRTSKYRDGVTVAYSFSNQNNRLLCWNVTSTNLDTTSNSHYGARRAQSTSRLVAPAVLFLCKEWVQRALRARWGAKMRIAVTPHQGVDILI